MLISEVPWATPTSRRKRSPTWAVIVVLTLSGTVVALQQTLVIPLLHEFSGILQVSSDDVSWLVTAALLTAAVATPIMSRLAVALMSGTLGIGGTLGLPPSGIIYETLGWHAIFWLSAGTGTALPVGVLLVVGIECADQGSIRLRRRGAAVRRADVPLARNLQGWHLGVGQ